MKAYKYNSVWPREDVNICNEFCQEGISAPRAVEWDRL
jgi:hypothetical protein